MEHLTKDDWIEWLSLPQTKAFLNAIKQEQYDTMRYAIYKVDMDPLHQARIIGLMSGLQKVLDFDYTDGTDKN